MPNLAATSPTDRPSVECPMLRFIDIIAGKWAIPILYRLIVLDDAVRFSELQRAIGRITQKELTKQLRAFEQRGLVSRQVFAQVPPRVEYRITALGATLREPLSALAAWMDAHAEELRATGG
ncbi:helix-turn-helix domain-containing protein [Pseudomonas sp. RIT-PI-AD]|uniref:winged helix-turn-helix transcriptional regulator n=1 Tax=Pseudomonas sp. RIT-PI-AD TaxID=3035294 RepID=UPI0021D95573|nr:helix-turn-helix domain-containing protein [Pseudomonas sp. RIT-PI-AD]